MAIALIVLCSGSIRAELTASQIVSQFNSLGTNGWSFNSTGSVTERRFYNNNNAPDLRAYSSALGTSGIYAMCVGSGSSAPSSGTAKLNYEAATGLTRNNSNVALSVGGAVLYQRYASATINSHGNIFDYSTAMNTGNRSNDASTLRSAIMTLNNATSTNSVNWTSNKYLQYLLTLRDDREYWIRDYNTNLRYNELGDFAVFMMNVGSGYQTHLYVSYASHLGNYENGGVPEPATLLLWTLGMGAFGVGHFRKRSRKA